MITEEQRRALFALREALKLCEAADVHLTLEGNDFTALWLICHNDGPEPAQCYFEADQVRPEHIDRLLAEHPE